MSDWTDVAPADEFTPGTWRVIETDDDTVIAVFNLDGEFHAIENLCTHEYAVLTDGEVCGGRITCPLHGAEFDIRTGEALSAPAYEPVPTFPTRIHEGVVQVRDPRWD